MVSRIMLLRPPLLPPSSGGHNIELLLSSQTGALLKEAEPMARLKIAVIGAGRIGQIHARNVAAHPAALLAGISDPDRAAADRLAQATESTVIDPDSAFRADAVMICSPTTTHADYIERAAAAGKPAFCEKPVDLSADRVRVCLDAVRRAGIPLMIGFNRR